MNLDFDLENSKLVKGEAKGVPTVVYDSHLKDIVTDIKTTAGETSKDVLEQQEEQQRVVDLQGCKYNLLYHLGEEKLKTICSRTESQLKLGENRVYPDKKLTNEQEELKNIVAFYGKEVFVPSV